jgi:1-acyl-sn-glycerol-3-phosphate acyltransferase
MVRIIFFRILSVIIFGIMYLFTAVMVLIGLPFIFLGRNRIVSTMMRFWAKGIFFILGKKIIVEGTENISDNLHFILVANHSSLFDIIAIVSLIPDLSWFGHERLLNIPVFRRVLLLTDYIAMKKTSHKNTREMISQLITKSKRRNIAIFPEGTRTLDGKINDFYRGFIILLRASSTINILPLTLNGFYSLKPKNRSFIDFNAKLQITIHPPYTRESLIDRSDREIAEIIKGTIESSLINGVNHYDMESVTENYNSIKA